jgi:hypothetical protein
MHEGPSTIGEDVVSGAESNNKTGANLNTSRKFTAVAGALVASLGVAEQAQAGTNTVEPDGAKKIEQVQVVHERDLMAPLSKEEAAQFGEDVAAVEEALSGDGHPNSRLPMSVDQMVQMVQKGGGEGMMASNMLDAYLLTYFSDIARECDALVKQGNSPAISDKLGALAAKAAAIETAHTTFASSRAVDEIKKHLRIINDASGQKSI